jgi:hypothetical protein
MAPWVQEHADSPTIGSVGHLVRGVGKLRINDAATSVERAVVASCGLERSASEWWTVGCSAITRVIGCRVLAC